MRCVLLQRTYNGRLWDVSKAKFWQKPPPFNQATPCERTAAARDPRQEETPRHRCTVACHTLGSHTRTLVGCAGDFACQIHLHLLFPRPYFSPYSSPSLTCSAKGSKRQAACRWPRRREVGEQRRPRPGRRPRGLQTHEFCFGGKQLTRLPPFRKSPIRCREESGKNREELASPGRPSWYIVLCSIPLVTTSGEQSCASAPPTSTATRLLALSSETDLPLHWWEMRERGRREAGGELEFDDRLKKWQDKAQLD
jgi:hypothetical protein